MAISDLSAYKLEQKNFSQSDWDLLQDAIQNGGANFMQSWAYGEAMREIGLKVERFIIKCHGKPIGFFQLTKKRILLFNFIKIDRGPLFFDMNDCEEHIFNVLKLMKKEWRPFKGQSLLVEPELIMTAQNKAKLQALGFKQAGKLCWESSLIDLSQKEEILLSNMDQKWRNQLRKSWKNNLTVKKSYDQKDFLWLMDQYNTFKNQTKFKGSSIPLLNALFKQMMPKKDMKIFIANYGDKPVAGVIAVMHGPLAYYLIGWNSEEGRNLETNRFLLWEVIKEMKQKGKKYFDLGGVFTQELGSSIQYKKYKTISHFKSGLNGNRYQLVGKFF